MKLFISLIFVLVSLQAQNFTKQNLLGSWELSSAKLNQIVSFGKYIGKNRNEVLELLFNPQGLMKVVSTGDVYNYEVVQGQLKIYETKVYRNNYQIKRKSRYDLMKIVGSFEGCEVVKIVEKKIPGYKQKYDLKMCKTSNLPQPTYQSEISRYKF
ncbi:hypothetical protein [Candidatus Sulfurimonas baltica]|uniref:Lipocalin-like domain-containing protein n=1 Tax=Candidatus Sulfurimonas baltica TaxID=2740404 RepID=A0A7S7LXJ9_9BACT|nr:hypothetical protein [Candidatus Sulfurimonas baltica]QOY53245.1 hypothetical protein HUE88_06075 [Candidatus Sulfurimonas baltica]